MSHDLLVQMAYLFLSSFFSILPFITFMYNFIAVSGVLTPAKVQLQFLSSCLSIMIEEAHVLIGKQGPHLTPNATVSPH